MNRSVGISALAHTLLILAAMFSGQIFEADSARAIQITEVEILNAEEFAAALSTAPDAPREALAALTPPDADALALDSPQDVTPPEIADAARPGADTADDVPDLGGLRDDARAELLPDAPEAPQDLAQNDAPDGTSLVTPQVIGPAVAPSERQRPDATALAPPAPPAPAPRISTTPAEKPPTDAQEAEEAAPEVAPDAESSEQAEERLAEAPPEAATEIVPEANEEQSEPESAAPLASAPPRRRPERDIVQSAAETEATSPPPAAAPAASPSNNRPAGPSVTQAEKDGITLPIRGEWNFGTLRGVEGWEQLVVEVRFSVAADGSVSNLRPHKPVNPQGNFKRAYDVARRAILIAERKGLLKFPPQEKYERWKDIIITFDPKSERVGF